MNNQSIVLYLLFLLAVTLPFSSVAQIRNVGSVSIEAGGSLFGQHIRAADVTGDGAKEIFLGAPGFNANGIPNAGAIFFLEPPFSGNIILGGSHILLRGRLVDEAIGENFELGDFNGDNITDIAVASLSQQTILIFFGPLSSANPRNAVNPDVSIRSFESNTLFGTAISLLEDVNNDGLDELAISANQQNTDVTNGGRVFLFNLQQEFINGGQFRETDRSLQFTGTEEGAQFGTGLQTAEDINGDDIDDIIIGAHRSNINGTNSGVGYLFFGPFNSADITDADADVIIPGRIADSFWGSRILNLKDVTGDGLEEIGFTSTFDGGGKMAVIDSRTVWPDTLGIDEESRPQNDITLFELNSADANFGTTAVFDIDFDLNGDVEPVVGAPLNGGGRGSLFQYDLGGRRVRTLLSGNTSQSELSRSMVNAGNVFIAGDDSVFNNDELTVLEIEDLLVGAPRDNGPFGNSGVVHVFSGSLQRPSVSLNFQPGVNVLKGETVEVRASFDRGSLPLENIRLLIDNEERTLLPSESPFDTVFTRAEQQFIQFNLIATDEIGLGRSVRRTLRFADKPADFELIEPIKSDTIRLQGEPSNTFEFASEPSSDPDGLDITYQLMFSLDEEEFFERTAQVVANQGSPVFDMRFSDLNDFLIDEAIPLNQIEKVYWTVRARNGVFGTVASDSVLGSFHMVRQGLEPAFELTSGDRTLIIDGLPEQTFEFDWSALSTENPNALVRYEFQLLEQTDNPESVIFRTMSNDNGFDTKIDVQFGTIDSVLAANNLRETAKNDTAKLFYSVVANVDGQRNVFPDNEPQEAFFVIQNLIVSNPDETSDKPTSFKLLPNFPNPFNPTTTIQYVLPEATEVTITVYNILGKSVFTWNSGRRQSAGLHSFKLNAGSWSSGIYIYQVKAGRQLKSGKMSLIK